MADSNTSTGSIVQGLIGLAVIAGVVFVIFWAGSKGVSAGKSNG